jgi:hypothetical protein
VPSNIGIQLKDKIEAIMPENSDIALLSGLLDRMPRSLKIPYLSAQASKIYEFWSEHVEFHNIQLWYSTSGQIQLLQRPKNPFTKALPSSFDSKQELTKNLLFLNIHMHTC